MIIERTIQAGGRTNARARESLSRVERQWVRWSGVSVTWLPPWSGFDQTRTILIWPQREHSFTPNGSTGQGSVVGWAHNLRAGTVTKSCKENPPHLALKLMRGPLEASPCDCVLL